MVNNYIHTIHTYKHTYMNTYILSIIRTDVISILYFSDGNNLKHSLDIHVYTFIYIHTCT
jgi:hypothetical protein